MMMAIAGIATALLSAETHTTDLAKYTVPDGWKREEKARTFVSHTQVDQKNGTWCQLYVWLSMASAGNLDTDFATEWETLVRKNFGALDPEPRAARALPGWQVKAATASGTRNSGKLWVYQHTYSSGTKRMTFTATTNQPTQYQAAIDAFFGSIALPTAEAAPPAVIPANPAATSGKTTNFDDGWVAVEQPDWVQVTKDGVVVLLHYRLPDLRPFNNLDEATAFAWNQLVAPRYRNISNVWFRRSFWSDGDAFNGKYFAAADARDQNGRPVYVAFYKNGTNGKWIEIITPDQASFQRRFTTVQRLDGTNWDQLTKLAGYNKFAVTAADIIGNWESASGAGVQYYDVYTGNNAGFAYASSTNSFAFRPDGTYTSVYKGAHNAQDGRGTIFSGETFTGRFAVSNWEMSLTNRFKGASHTFSAMFEAVKGGRILHLYRGNVEDFHLFKRR